MSQNFTSDFKVTPVLAPVAAGTTAQTSSGVYMGGPDGFDNVVFMVPFGAITTGAVTSVKVQQSQDDGATDTYDDLAGSSQSVPDTGSNGIVLVEVVRPNKPYVRVAIGRGTQNAAILQVYAFQFHSRSHPPAQSASILSSLILVSPPEGTA